MSAGFSRSSTRSVFLDPSDAELDALEVGAAQHGWRIWRDLSTAGRSYVVVKVGTVAIVAPGPAPSPPPRRATIHQGERTVVARALAAFLVQDSSVADESMRAALVEAELLTEEDGALTPTGVAMLKRIGRTALAERLARSRG